jgi:putative hydrolase of the HAD superfamily
MTIRTLELIRKDSFKTGMITNCPLETPLLWPDTELFGFIDVPVFSCMEKLRKPDTRLFELCAERLGLRPDECVFIGDGANDELAAAASAGMTPVLLNNGCPVSLKRASQFNGLTVSSLIDIPLMLSLW